VYSTTSSRRSFRDLETKIEQLSLLIDLSAAVNATLDPEKIYEQAVQPLVHRMGYERRISTSSIGIEGSSAATRPPAARAASSRPWSCPSTTVRARSPGGDDRAAASRRRRGGEPNPAPPGDRPRPRCARVRRRAAAGERPDLRRADGGLERADRFAAGDLELMSAVANHVALAVDRAESFQMIEELTRGLEDKVRVRTEQLRAANEELQAAYRDLQLTQIQLIQRRRWRRWASSSPVSPTS